MGIVGTAIGTVVARILGAIFMFSKIQKTEMAFKLHEIFIQSNYRACGIVNTCSIRAIGYETWSSGLFRINYIHLV